MRNANARRLRRTISATALFAAAVAAVPAKAEVEVVVVTAEKRAADVQTVPVAISVFTSESRDRVGINSIQDMTNFTPGLQYNTSTDRVSLRGVGRMTNVLSADASVANYDDGLYETFAVAAGRSSLDLDRVEVLRGPQGTLYGRNAIAGALNEIVRRPPDQFEGEVRATYGAYDHYTLEGAVGGPIDDQWKYRVYGVWDRQLEGYAKNIIPGLPSEYGRLNNWYADAQLQASFFGGKLDMWTKFQTARWDGGAGNAGSQSSGWNPYDSPTYEYGTAVTSLNPGYGCTAPGFSGATANTTVSGATSPLPAAIACRNPEVNSPWKISRPTPYDVNLPDYETLNTQWTLHLDGFDVKYIGGGTYYHYILTGPNNAGAGGTATGAVDVRPPISGFDLLGGIHIGGDETFNYQEKNAFISNEINVLSTGDEPLQWAAGVYQFQQHYSQPVYTTQPLQPEWNGPFGLPSVFCAQTGGVCAPETGFRRFDNRPAVHDSSYAGYFQLDYKASSDLKLTGGLRYSWDRKYGIEQVRLLCFAVPACYASPELAPFIGGVPPVDLTQIGTVVATGVDPATGQPDLPRGVTSVTHYNPANGLASRSYDANWSAVTGTAGVEWTPDEATLVYAKYSRGYKSGGFNIGIFTVLSFSPYTAAEHVNSLEIGAKKTFSDWLTVDGAIFRYNYTNLQIPLGTVQTAGGLAQSETAFFNVPTSVSQGLELETIISPIEHLTVLANYSYLDAYVASGVAADPADPNATAPGATPIYTPTQCAQPAHNNTPGGCSTDIYTLTGGGNGWNIPQNLAGNRLPNAPRNKVAINVNYAWQTDFGTFTPSVSFIWRDKQYGVFFTRSYNEAPDWTQWDARLSWQSEDDKWEAILFGKNIFNTIGYDSGAIGTRLAGSVDLGPAFAPINFVQGVNGPAGYNRVRGENATGQVTTYYVTPPSLWGIELHYKFD